MALSRVKTWGQEELTYPDLNAEFNNILNNALSLISPLTANLDAGGFAITGAIAGSALTGVPVINSLIANTFTYFTSAGTQPVYTLTPSPAITAYAAGQMFLVKIHSTNASDTAPTLNVSAVGAKNIFSNHGTVLAQNDLLIGGIYLMVYDGTQFRAFNIDRRGEYLLKSEAISAAATKDYEVAAWYDGTYSELRFELGDITVGTDNDNVWLRVKDSSYQSDAGDYTYELHGVEGGGSAFNANVGNNTRALYMQSVDNSTTDNNSASIVLKGLPTRSVKHVFRTSVFFKQNGGNMYTHEGWMRYNTASPITGIRFGCDGSTFSATMRVYGTLA